MSDVGQRAASPEEGCVTESGGPADSRPYFFLSYAHTPRADEYDTLDPDIWVGDFYRDICRHLFAITDLPSGAKAGFMDQELRPGNVWPAKLAEALATCRVFVPLYSLRYFKSEHCGREWFAFSRRVAAQGPNPGHGAIIPALWVPVGEEQLPLVARDVHFTHRDLGSRYPSLGFYRMIINSRYRDDYQEAVAELAHRIRDVAEASPVRPGPPPDYHSLESAFGPDSRAMPGDKQLRITIVAPYRAALPAGRGADHYGQTAQQWKPYELDADRSLPAHAADLARHLGYRPDVADLDLRTGDLLSDDPPAGPEVLIIDPWAVTQQDCQEVLRRLDQKDKPWVQVVIVWNAGDPETAAASSRLRKELETALPKKLTEGRATSAMAVRGVPDLESFSSVLPTVIKATVRQYLRYAPAHPPDGAAMA